MPSLPIFSKQGPRILAFYFGLTYFFPLVANALLGSRIPSPYKIFPLTPLAVLSLVATVLLYALLSSFDRMRLPRMEGLGRWASRFGAFYSRWRLALGIVSLPFCLLYLLMGLTSYRYTAVSISQRQSLILIGGMVLQCGLSIDLFYTLFVQSKKAVEPYTRIWLENSLLSVSLLLLSSGTADVFLALFAVFYSLAPATFKKLYFPRANRAPRERFQGFGASVLVAALIFGISWPCGEIIKIASSRGTQYIASTEDVDLLDQQNNLQNSQRQRQFLFGTLIEIDPVAAQRRRANLKNTLVFFTQPQLWWPAIVRRFERKTLPKPPPVYVSSKPSLWRAFRQAAGEFTPQTYALYLVQGLSVHYYSHLLLSTMPRDELSQGVVNTPAQFPLRSLFFRADTLLGGIGGVQRPYIPSISVLNYRILSKLGTNRREGTSPGLVGSFEYLFAFPWWIVAAALYLVFLSRFFDGVLYRGNRETLSLVAIFIALKYTDIFFSAPADFILFFDNGFIKFVLLLGVYLACRSPVYEPERSEAVLPTARPVTSGT